MRTIRTKVYKFEELNKSAQQTAISNYLATNYENIELWNFAEECAEYAKEQGFNNAKVRYSLSYSQGDGLSFDADLDLPRLIKECKPNIKQSVLDVILNNCYGCCESNPGKGFYSYAHPTDVSFYIDTTSYNEYNRLTDYVNDIKIYIQDKYMQVCGTLEANGYAEIEYQDSEEYAKERIIGNEYEFTIDGNIF